MDRFVNYPCKGFSVKTCPETRTLNFSCFTVIARGLVDCLVIAHILPHFEWGFTCVLTQPATPQV
jgi:hypothetical protein